MMDLEAAVLSRSQRWKPLKIRKLCQSIWAGRDRDKEKFIPEGTDSLIRRLLQKPVQSGAAHPEEPGGFGFVSAGLLNG